MAVIFAEGFEELDEEGLKQWWGQRKKKSPTLPPNCIVEQIGDFETEILECPYAYAIVEKGKYEWVQSGGHWILQERESEKEK